MLDMVWHPYYQDEAFVHGREGGHQGGEVQVHDQDHGPGQEEGQGGETLEGQEGFEEVKHPAADAFSFLRACLGEP